MHSNLLHPALEGALTDMTATTTPTEKTITLSPFARRTPICPWPTGPRPVKA